MTGGKSRAKAESPPRTGPEGPVVRTGIAVFPRESARVSLIGTAGGRPVFGHYSPLLRGVMIAGSDAGLFPDGVCGAIPNSRTRIP